MANPDRPNGFRPVATFSGAPWQGLVRRGKMGDGDGTDVWDNIYIGDPVVFDASESNEIIPAFTTIANVLGVCVGVGYVPAGQPANESGMFNVADLEKRYGDASLVATQDVYIYYVPVADVLFEVQSDSDLDLFPGDETDHNCTTGSSTHGSVVTSLSNVELKASGDDVHIVAIPEYIDNDSTLANTRYWVRFFDRSFDSKDDANS